MARYRPYEGIADVYAALGKSLRPAAGNGILPSGDFGETATQVAARAVSVEYLYGRAPVRSTDAGRV